MYTFPYSRVNEPSISLTFFYSMMFYSHLVSLLFSLHAKGRRLGSIPNQGRVSYTGTSISLRFVELFVIHKWQHPLFELAVACFPCHVGRANGEIGNNNSHPTTAIRFIYHDDGGID